MLHYVLAGVTRGYIAPSGPKQMHISNNNYMNILLYMYSTTMLLQATTLSGQTPSRAYAPAENFQVEMFL